MISLLRWVFFELVHLEEEEAAEDGVATMAPVFLDRRLGPRLGLVGTYVPYVIAHAVKDDFAVVASAILMSGVAVLGEAIRSAKGAAALVALVREMARRVVLVQGLHAAKSAIAHDALNARWLMDAGIDVLLERGGTAKDATAAPAPMRIVDGGIAVLAQGLGTAKAAVALFAV